MSLIQKAKNKKLPSELELSKYIIPIINFIFSNQFEKIVAIS